MKVCYSLYLIRRNNIYSSQPVCASPRVFPSQRGSSGPSPSLTLVTAALHRGYRWVRREDRIEAVIVAREGERSEEPC